jgi:hypothetical protein
MDVADGATEEAPGDAAVSPAAAQAEVSSSPARTAVAGTPAEIRTMESSRQGVKRLVGNCAGGRRCSWQ